MKILASTACVVLSLVVLSACGKTPAAPGDADNSAGAPATAATASDPLAGVSSGPGLKAGLWQTTVKTSAMTSGSLTSKMCLDDALSKKFQDMGTSNPGKMDCKPVSGSRNGNVIDITTVCKDDSLTVNNQMHMEITGEDSYHQTVTQSYTPELMKPTTSEIDGKYLGACPADMKPGDLDLGGMKINMYTHKAEVKS